MLPQKKPFLPGTQLPLKKGPRPPPPPSPKSRPQADPHEASSDVDSDTSRKDLVHGGSGLLFNLDSTVDTTRDIATRLDTLPQRVAQREPLRQDSERLKATDREALWPDGAEVQATQRQERPDGGPPLHPKIRDKGEGVVSEPIARAKERAHAKPTPVARSPVSRDIASHTLSYSQLKKKSAQQAPDVARPATGPRDSSTFRPTRSYAPPVLFRQSPQYYSPLANYNQTFQYHSSRQLPPQDPSVGEFIPYDPASHRVGSWLPPWSTRSPDQSVKILEHHGCGCCQWDEIYDGRIVGYEEEDAVEPPVPSRWLPLLYYYRPTE